MSQPFSNCSFQAKKKNQAFERLSQFAKVFKFCYIFFWNKKEEVSTWRIKDWPFSEDGGIYYFGDLLILSKQSKCSD